MSRMSSGIGTAIKAMHLMADFVLHALGEDSDEAEQ